MNDYVKPGDGLLFMKVGMHAQEDLAAIIARKTEEVVKTGYGMWGYGGSTCHPTSMVQPFAHLFAERGRVIHLCMEPMDSKHSAAPLCAAEFSIDGVSWSVIPDTIQVRGSKYALVIADLHKESFVLPLERTRVSVGPSMGRIGSKYVSGRVDKACLEVVGQSELVSGIPARDISIGLVATLIKPYSVFLRGERR